MWGAFYAAIDDLLTLNGLHFITQSNDALILGAYIHQDVSIG